MRAIPHETIDLVITSPPYFNTKDYSRDGYQESSHSTRATGQIGDIHHFEDFIDGLLTVWRECERVLRPNGKLVINSPLIPMLKKDLNTHENRHIFDLNAAIQTSILTGLPRMFLLDTYIWNRTNPSKKLMFGSYPFPTNFYAQNTIEFVTVYVKAGKALRRSDDSRLRSELTQDEWIDFTKQVWDIPVPNKADLGFGIHSALMPEEIVRRCVRLYSFHGDVVLDPFAGSGTTLKVAQELGRHFVGYELVSSYKEVINQKLGKPVCVKAPRSSSEGVITPSIPSHLLNAITFGDAVEFLRELPSNTIPLVCVDPPYNLGKGPWDTWASDREFRAFTQKWLNEVFRVMRLGAGIFIFNTPRNCAYILAHAEAQDMQLQNWITWDKRDGFAATKKRFVPAQETILYLTKKGAPPYFDAEAVRVPYESTERIAAAVVTGILKNGKRWYPNESGKLCTDVWHVTSQRHKTKVRGRITKSEHPTQKPTELIERMILAASRPNDIVLDCFMGTGTTAEVAIANGRQFMGCEADRVFYELALRRIQAASDMGAVAARTLE